MNERDTPLLDVRGLTTHYVSARGTRVTRAVEDVSFTLRDGETLGIVGESGSGKSTLALSLLRLLPPARAALDHDPEHDQDDDEDQETGIHAGSRAVCPSRASASAA